MFRVLIISLTIIFVGCADSGIVSMSALSEGRIISMMPQSIDGEFQNTPSSLRYGIAKYVSSDDKIFGQSVSSDRTFMIALSSTPIDCHSDLSSQNQDVGTYFALFFSGPTEGNITTDLEGLNVGLGASLSLPTGGNEGGQILAVSNDYINGYFQYYSVTENFLVTLYDGSFSVVRCNSNQ